jgi:hypothetical protein
MPQPLIGASELPPMNILQMILEGPRGYFGRRGQQSDALFFQNQAQQQAGQFAKGLLGTPEFKQAVANPYDRAAQYGLWANTQGGPADIARQGGNWLQTSIEQAYRKEGQSFEDALAKQRIVLGTDEALRLEMGKAQIEAQQKQQQWDAVFGTDPATGQSRIQSQFMRDMAYNALAHSLGVPTLEPGISIGVDANRQPVLTPTPGGKPWQEMMDGLTPLQQIGNAVAELQDMSGPNGNMEPGRAKQLIQLVQDGIRIANKTGALDASAQLAMGNYIDNYSSLYGYAGGAVGAVLPYGSKSYGQAMEKLRGLKVMTDQKINDWSRKYQQDPMSPQIGDPYRYTRPAEKAKLPDISADEAMKKLQPKQNEPQPQPSSKVRPGPLPANAEKPAFQKNQRDTGMRARGGGGRK